MTDETSTTSLSDSELLRRYVERSSVPAFEELVHRHINPVFSAALRRLNGEHSLAQDVTQMVFIDLARKAPNIARDIPLGGWLHRHTGFVASKMVDKDRRRRAREKEAALMESNPLSSSDDSAWAQTAPFLDAALDKLPASDRDAIVLRFFEQKDYRSVGSALGMSDDSAQKKVSRAVEKLRSLLARRGITSTGGALAALLTTQSVEAAPTTLIREIHSHALASAATASGTLSGALLGLGTITKIKAASVALLLVATAGFVGSRFLAATDPIPHTNVALRVEERETAILDSENEADSPSVVAAMDVAALISAAAVEWRGGRTTVPSMAKALGYLAQINASQMPEALQLAVIHSDEPARELLIKHLLSHWAENDPVKAMEWVTQHPTLSHRADVTEGILNAWAGRDPMSVMGWHGKSKTTDRVELSESVIGTVFRTIASTDPAEALAKLSFLDGLNDRSQALRGILDTVQSETDREKLATLISKISEDDVRIQARRAMVEQWARRDSLAAANYVETAEPLWERTRLMDSLGLTWLQTDPSAAAEWWVQKAPGPDTLVKIINVWAQQDPNAAGEWLGQQVPGPGTDTARMTFARQVADLDPESALRWAETVTDQPLREDTISHIFNHWRLRNTDEANSFLLNSGWPSERISRLQLQNTTSSKTNTP